MNFAVQGEAKSTEIEMTVIRANGLIEPLGVHSFTSQEPGAVAWWRFTQWIKRRLPVRLRNWWLLRRASPEHRAEVQRVVAEKLAQQKGTPR